jgi:hypothetical protein
MQINCCCWRDLLRDGELGEVVADHLGLDLDLVELLAGVDTNDGTDHLRDDDHVTEVSLDEVGLLVGLGLLLGLAELLDQTHGLALEATVETSAGTSVDDIAELLAGEVEEPEQKGSVGRPRCALVDVRQRQSNVCARCLYVLVKVDATVRELAERSLGLKGYTTKSMSADILSSTPLCGLSTGFHPYRRAFVPAACSGSWEKSAILRIAISCAQSL